MKIISGGQTGADQAGIFAAHDNRIETGGYAPSRYMTIDGSNPELGSIYGLIDCKGGYKKRTNLNVENSDCTIRFAYDFSSTGEICTHKALVLYKKPYMDVNLTYITTDDDIRTLYDWITNNRYEIINIAGNAQRNFDVFTPTYKILDKLFKMILER